MTYNAKAVLKNMFKPVTDYGLALASLLVLIKGSLVFSNICKF